MPMKESAQRTIGVSTSSNTLPSGGKYTLRNWLVSFLMLPQILPSLVWKMRENERYNDADRASRTKTDVYISLNNKYQNAYVMRLMVHCSNKASHKLSCKVLLNLENSPQFLFICTFLVAYAIHLITPARIVHPFACLSRRAHKYFLTNRNIKVENIYRGTVKFIRCITRWIKLYN